MFRNEAAKMVVKPASQPCAVIVLSTGGVYPKTDVCSYTLKKFKEINEMIRTIS